MDTHSRKITLIWNNLLPFYQKLLLKNLLPLGTILSIKSSPNFLNGFKYKRQTPINNSYLHLQKSSHVFQVYLFTLIMAC